MTCNPTARVDGDGDGLKIRVVAVRDPDVVVDKGDRFEAPPVHGDDLSVSNGDGRPLHTSSRLQALISELKCGILLVGPSPCGLRQRGFQPAVSLSDPAAFALSGAAIIARAHAGPGSQMVTTGEGDLCRSCPHSDFRLPVSDSPARSKRKRR